ncbi:MAG: c-type cytochrome domain-containing protein, partial [Planctomycetota bacterium]|nr:c-type cytochrome domain-containing protein [Planctomycetota bacterium]
MKQNFTTFLTLVFFLVFVIGLPSLTKGQEQAREPKIDYLKTIKPILDHRCSTCHDSESSAAGLDLEDLDLLQDYLTPGKPLESSLFQSLTGSNDLPQMPPEEDDEGDPLEPCLQSEIALIYLWIQQGASFEGVNTNVAKPKEQSLSPAYRIFLFSGYFHPAVVHFPIALITLSAFFIIFFFRNESISDDAAFYLLLFGTLSSVVA